MGEMRKSFLLLRGSACPSDNSVRVKSVQLILDIGLCHLLEGNQYFMKALRTSRQVPALKQSSVNEECLVQSMQ